MFRTLLHDTWSDLVVTLIEKETKIAAWFVQEDEILRFGLVPDLMSLGGLTK
jgi:hypothetical protein